MGFVFSADGNALLALTDSISVWRTASSAEIAVAEQSPARREPAKP
jgi:hypothetical protein